MPWQPNPGRLPAECLVLDEDGNVTGYRKVHVRLFGGSDTKKSGRDPWPSAGGRPATNWSISRTPHPFEIEEYELA